MQVSNHEQPSQLEIASWGCNDQESHEAESPVHWVCWQLHSSREYQLEIGERGCRTW